MVTSARVNQAVKISEEQQQKLQKNDAIKSIMNSYKVQITISDGTAKIRGFFYDVRDAAAVLKEKLTGVYEATIELDSSQFSRVRSACKDPSHFQRMETASGAKVKLDLSAGVIALSGKRNAVKKAKEQVFGFLDFLIPKEILLMKITKPLQMSVGTATSLAEVSANAGGASVYLDRDLNSLVLRSAQQEKLQVAKKLIAFEEENNKEL